MAVVSKAQQLKVNAAVSFNHFLIPGALFIAVRLCSVRDIGILHVNINVLEKVVIHEIVVTLVIIPCQAPVFIQVHAPCLRKIQVALVVPFNQLLVGADRGGAGCQSKYAVRF